MCTKLYEMNQTNTYNWLHWFFYMDYKVCWVLWIGRWHKLPVICLSIQPWFAPSRPPYFLSDCSAYYITLDLATYLSNIAFHCHGSCVTCLSQVTCPRLQAQPAELPLQLSDPTSVASAEPTYISLGYWGFYHFYNMHQQTDTLNAQSFTSCEQENWNDLAKPTALKANFPLRSAGPQDFTSDTESHVSYLSLYFIHQTCNIQSSCEYR